MPTPPGRFAQLRWLQNVVCLVAIISALAVMGVGLAGAGSEINPVNALMVVAGGVVLFIAIIAMTLAPLFLKIESHIARQLSESRDVNEALTRHEAMFQAIVENTRISDAAKSLAHRDQELEALRAVIRDNFRSENWDAALNLVDEMERRFGYKDESDRFREELDDARNEAIESKLHEALELLESHFASHSWDRAQGEIDRLRHALPDNAKVMALHDRMAAMKNQHKDELLHQWDEAVRRNDTDQAIDVLKSLDAYLSAAEAEALRASARDVFKDKLLQIGVKFRFAVMEKRWDDAVSTGMELIRDYPNARMAGEVRDAMDALREHARAG